MKIFDGMRVVLGGDYPLLDVDVRVIRYDGQFDWRVEYEDTDETTYGPTTKETIQSAVDDGFYVPAPRVRNDYGQCGDSPPEPVHDEPVAPKDFFVEPLGNGDVNVHPVADRMPSGSPVFPSSDSKVRDGSPVVTGCFDYFPLALLEISRFSRWGNGKHNPGEPLHWSRGKSIDHANKIGRHLLERGTLDPDTGGQFSHSVGLAWRALALLQKELELAQGYDRDAVE